MIDGPHRPQRRRSSDPRIDDILDMVRAFANDAPPAKLSFFTSPLASTAKPRSGMPSGCLPLAQKLRISDAGLSALVTDWLQGCYTAPSIEEALAWRSQLQAGETLLVQAGHAVDLNSVVFYAQDSEQAGLLGRAQDIENLEKQQRAQTLIAEESRSALVRAEAAYADASQRLVSVRREAAEAQTQAHGLQVETLRLSQLAEQARARSAQIDADLASHLAGSDTTD